MERGDYRLELARRLLALEYGADVMAKIKTLSYSDKEKLRGCVDWLEDYEKRDKENQRSI